MKGREKSKNSYPYNLLLSMFSQKSCYRAQAKNIMTMMNIASKRDTAAKITLAYFKDGLSYKEIADRYSCSVAQVPKAIHLTQCYIIKYKDAIFNGFNGSKVCMKLREEFRKLTVPEEVILIVNKCGIYDINDFNSMDSKEFMNLLTDKLDANESAMIITELLPRLEIAGFNVAKKLLATNYVDFSNVIGTGEAKTADIFRIVPSVMVHFHCPHCNKDSSIRFEIKSNAGSIFCEKFDGKECTCPKCHNNIVLRRVDKLL